MHFVATTVVGHDNLFRVLRAIVNYQSCTCAGFLNEPHFLGESALAAHDQDHGQDHVLVVVKERYLALCVEMLSFERLTGEFITNRREQLSYLDNRYRKELLISAL